MAKVGAALDIKAAQAGPVGPTPNETLAKILRDSLGPTADSMEIQPETTMESIPQGGAPAPQPMAPGPSGLGPVASETAGFTPEGQLLPMKERFMNAQQGVQRPEFNQWQQSGLETPGGRMAPVANTQGTAFDGFSDLMGRATHMAKLMDPTYREENGVPFPTIGIKDTNVTQKADKQRYVDLNRAIALSKNPEEVARLEQERAQVARTNERENTILGQYLNKLKVMQINPETGYASPDRKFFATGAVATEHALDGAFLGTDASTEAYLREGEEVEARSSDLINPSDLAERVGRETVKWWAAEKEADGQPINKNLSTQELKDLGGAFLLSYARANPRLINVVNTKKNAQGDYVKDETGSAIRFELTREGQVIYDANRSLREMALGNILDPLMAPVEAGLPGAMGEERPAYRKQRAISGEGRDSSYATLAEFEESIRNQQSVGHVVDDRRTRIATVMMLPAIFGKIGQKGDAFGDYFGIGLTSVKTIMNEKQMLKGMEREQAIDEAVKITGKKKSDLMQDLMTAIRFRGRSNYLTYAMQPLAGRTMVQQTDFNPTRKKFIRFVTRSKHPAKVTPGSRLENNYLNIMSLSFGQDQKLEAGRLQDLRENEDKYYMWGKILSEALESTLPQKAFEMAATAIRSGKNLPPELVQGLSKFQQTIAGKDNGSGLMELLNDKGEDAPMAIDALIDFKNYVDAKKAGKPHNTFVNAYIDGKTNGIANQGMMLGNRELAIRVGALRPDGSTDAVSGGDIRDAMREIILDRLVNNSPVPAKDYDGQPDRYQKIQLALEEIAKAKPVNKAISMIFPYGKEIGGMKAEIAKIIPELRASNQALDDAMNFVNDDKLIIDAAHDNVVYALFDIFGEDTFNARGVMRSVGYMHAIVDQLFSIRGPAGHRILLGDNRTAQEPRSKSRVSVSMNGKDPDTLLLQDSKQYMSSAAERDGEPVGWVRGRANVIPTQSIDGATVVRTSTGKTWDKMKSSHPAGEPYFFQIYDAFKVDVHSYDTIVHDANKNFLDITTRDWNYIDEARKEFNRLSEYVHKVADANPKAMYSLKGGKFDYVYKLMDPEYVQRSAGAVATYGTLKGFVRAAFPINPDFSYDEYGAKPHGKNKPTPSEIMEGYEKYVDARAKVLNRVILDAFNASTNDRVTHNSFTPGGRAPMEISVKQIADIFDAIEAEIELGQRLSKFTQKTNAQRAELRSEILRNYGRRGDFVAQFWAH